MSETFDYPGRRANQQSKWHSAKAAHYKRCFYLTEIITLLAGAAVPIVNLWPIKQTGLAGLLSAILGGVVVVASGIGKLGKFQENWLQFRLLSEAIKREEEYFKIGAGDYAKEDEPSRQRILVERVETLLAGTTAQFAATHQTSLKPGTPAIAAITPV